MQRKVRYYLNKNNEFVIENYNLSKPLANFFPGISGKFGIPMWVFYVNRGQCISSLGIKDKDHSILEFFPANKAWQFVSTLGFRTFIKLTSQKKTLLYEPFHNGFTNLNYKLNNSMQISSSSLTLEEENLTLGLKVKVEYFTIPNDTYAGLARIVTIKNLGHKPKSLQLIDGLPQIIPYGTSNLFLKKLGRTIEAWMQVENLDKDVPFYKLSSDPTDRPEVIKINGGNFYLSFYYTSNTPTIIRPIVNPQYVFGAVTDFSCPSKFLCVKKLILPRQESVESRTPSALSLLDLRLAPEEEKTLYALVGQMRNLEALNSQIKKITSRNYLIGKKEENKKVIESLQDDISTESNSRTFNLYVKQTYLDNILRGGYPLKISNHVFYLYSRKHGDLERDYNKFQLQPSYFSQGNGNYRDMNQNRRSDIWFNPAIGEENLLTFFNLLQTDGFNPLIIDPVKFLLKNNSLLNEYLKAMLEEREIKKLTTFLNKPFTPGELMLFLEEEKISLKNGFEEFLGPLVSHCEKIQEAEHGEGFWIDHWHYNLDLLESFLGVYPERLREIVFEKKCFSFYDNIETVRPREEKYILKDGLVRQLHALNHDSLKREMLRKRQDQPHLVRSEYGNGTVYHTTLINKLLCLLVNKLSSLDPNGYGIEMEADKPNWFDALNGLPGLFGSSSCETFELKRLVLFILQALEKTKIDSISITEEIQDFLGNLNNLLRENLQSNLKDRDFQYWDKSYALKENYRHKTKFGLSGREVPMHAEDLIGILNSALEKIEISLDKAKDKKTGLYYAYLINEVKEYEIIKEPHVKPLKFLQKRLPFFLEAQVHALRLSQNINKAGSLYKAVKRSELFDRKLKAYKVTSPLKDMPQDIGRCRVFTPGWLENESIWLHMEYKYLLEILKAGLYEEFYVEFKNLLIPFQDPKRYGRSILENSSFLVSSAFPDKSMHGNGFVARLSGSTAELINIWLIMNVGQNPFFLNEKGELNLRFNPILAGWLFKQDGLYSFNFLSKIKVTYHNPKRKNTFGKNKATINKILFKDASGNPVELASSIIPSPYAEEIRSRKINNIYIFFK